jgi:hypothetical protein
MGHLGAEEAFQKKSVRFTENHDESRAPEAFGAEKSLAAAVITSTIQGIRFFQDGQWDGCAVRVPVQLARSPEEAPVPWIRDAYQRLLAFANLEVLHGGRWELLKPLAAWDGNESFRSILCWTWKDERDCAWVVVNYAPHRAQARIRIPDAALRGQSVLLRDHMSGENYIRDCEEIRSLGLYVDLSPWQGHLFTLS